MNIETLPLIDLARMAHVYENQDNDIDFMRVMDEVARRDKMLEFRDLYMKVWKEFATAHYD